MPKIYKNPLDIFDDDPPDEPPQKGQRLKPEPKPLPPLRTGPYRPGRPEDAGIIAEPAKPDHKGGILYKKNDIRDDEPSFKKKEPRDFKKTVRTDSLDLKEFSEITDNPNFPTFIEKAKAIIKDHHANNKYKLKNIPYEQIQKIGMELGIPAASAGTIDYILSLYEDD